MKTTIKLAIASLVLVGAAHAASISGTIKIANLNNPTIDYGANTVTFDPGSPNAVVNGVDGDYSAISLLTGVKYTDFSYDPFSPVNPLWITLTGPGASFSLTSITYIEENPGDGLILKGYGVATLDGFDDTLGSWSFSADEEQGDFNFSSITKAPAEVPDGGGTLALLGLSVLGLGGARRLLASRR